MKKIVTRLKERFRTYGGLRTLLYYSGVILPTPVLRRLRVVIAKIFFWIGKNRLKVKVNNTEIFIDPSDPWAVWVYLFNLYYDREPITAFKSIPSHYIFFDVGANFGAWAFSLAEHFSRVYAIEPNPICYQCLCLTKKNKHADTVIPLDAALSDSDRSGQFFPNSTHIGDGRIYNPGDPGRAEATTVVIRSFDSLIQELNIRAEPFSIIMKVDTQGTEPSIIKGMTDTLSAASDFILYTEIDRPALEANGESVEGYLALLKESGFTPIDLLNGMREISWGDAMRFVRTTKNLCFRYTRMGSMDASVL